MLTVPEAVVASHEAVERHAREPGERRQQHPGADDEAAEHDAGVTWGEARGATQAGHHARTAEAADPVSETVAEERGGGRHDEAQHDVEMAVLGHDAEGQQHELTGDREARVVEQDRGEHDPVAVRDEQPNQELGSQGHCLFLGMVLQQRSYHIGFTL